MRRSVGRGERRTSAFDDKVMLVELGVDGGVVCDEGHLCGCVKISASEKELEKSHETKSLLEYTTETSRSCYAIVWMPNRATKCLHCFPVITVQ